MDNLRQEIEKRRTFAIISHPDAGKTTLTEKFLLYGGAINQAGSVKGKATAKHAVSDWMEIEKQRGISVTSSVLQFNYDGYCINILDTPGHQDFSEDTYRTLMAADSAVMVVENRYDGQLSRREGKLLSTSHPGFGTGLLSVETVAKKYHGQMTVETENGVFRVNVLLNL